ncbi:MAG: nuclear transport factor 2 family protein [Bacteroidota bacterium]
MKPLFSLLVFLLSTSLNAQTADEESVKQVVYQLFEGMRQGDSTMVRAAFTKDAEMYTVFTDKDGTPNLKKGSLQRFLTAVGTPHEGIWDEPIWDVEVQIDGNLAQVWTKYAFYLDDKFSHCGVDAFQLFKGNTGWEIFQLTDTRKKEGCVIPDHIKKVKK